MRVPTHEPFCDIHCHLLPAIDDGAKSWEESLAMARMAADDGIGTIIVTPHQLGNFAHNDGQTIRARTAELQSLLDEHQVALKVLPGADVRIEEALVARIRRGDVVTLADRRRHVLLELPHELYVPLDRLLVELASARMVGILSHPERNLGILAQPVVVRSLVDSGCLMQVTAGSLLGTFGPQVRKFSEWLLEEGLVHFIASDAHGCKSRRPLLGQAFQRVAELTSTPMAQELCCANPARVAEGKSVEQGRRAAKTRRLSDWLGWRKAV